MSPPRIFISYRRDDSSGHAGRLYDALADHFGSENVFIDVDTIRIGSDFAETIEQSIGDCDAVVALIGRDWTTAALAGGQRRLEDAGDFVRLELESALAHEISVIPVAVRGAAFPDADELPESLKPLARRQGIELRDSAWRDDVNRLIRRLEGITETESGEPRPSSTGGRPRRIRALAVVAAVAAVAVVAIAAVAIVASRGGGSPSGTHGNPQLLAAVPEPSRASCQPISYGAQSAEASVECYATPVVADYNLFSSAAVLHGWYVQQQEAHGISPGTRDCRPASFEREAGYGGGRYFCFFSGKGYPHIVWTDVKANVGAEASISSRPGTRSAADLLRQWGCCFKPQ